MCVCVRACACERKFDVQLQVELIFHLLIFFEAIGPEATSQFAIEMWMCVKTMLLKIVAFYENLNFSQNNTQKKLSAFIRMHLE